MRDSVCEKKTQTGGGEGKSRVKVKNKNKVTTVAYVTNRQRQHLPRPLAKRVTEDGREGLRSSINRMYRKDEMKMKMQQIASLSSVRRALRWRSSTPRMR